VTWDQKSFLNNQKVLISVQISVKNELSIDFPKEQ
jgi:hypothetical protein